MEDAAGDPKVGVPKLTLDRHERNTPMSHLDRVGVPELVRREPPSHPCSGGRVMQLLARG